MEDIWAERKRKRRAERKQAEVKQQQESTALKPVEIKDDDIWAKQKAEKQKKRLNPEQEEPKGSLVERSFYEEFRHDEESTHGISLEQKIALKKSLVEKYRDFCERFSKLENQPQDELYQNWVVWLADIEAWEDFLKHADIAFKHKQKPNFLKRDFLEFKRWTVLEWAEEKFKAKEDPREVFNRVFDEIEDFENVGQQLATRILTLKFKLMLEYGADPFETYQIGGLARRYGAQVKGKFEAFCKDQGWDPEGEIVTPEGLEGEEYETQVPTPAKVDEAVASPGKEPEDQAGSPGDTE